MVIEKKRHLLGIITRISDSAEVREYEASFLQKYACIMNNRQRFFINRQRASTSNFSGVFGLLTKARN